MEKKTEADLSDFLQHQLTAVLELQRQVAALTKALEEIEKGRSAKSYRDHLLATKPLNPLEEGKLRGVLRRMKEEAENRK